MKIIDRLNEYIEHKGISLNAFDKSIEASNGYIGRQIKNKASVGGDVIEKISCIYTDLNLEWLITGHGSMLKSEDNNISQHILNPENKEYDETRPRIPMDAAAGSLTIAQDGITLRDCEQIPIIKAFARYDFTIFARGDSMEPEYHSGDELACVYIRDSKFIQWGRVHVIDTSQGILVKRIFRGDKCIICKSDNPVYSEFSIDESEFYNVALVIGMIRRY